MDELGAARLAPVLDEEAPDDDGGDELSDDEADDGGPDDVPVTELELKTEDGPVLVEDGTRDDDAPARDDEDRAPELDTGTPVDDAITPLLDEDPGSAAQAPSAHASSAPQSESLRHGVRHWLSRQRSPSLQSESVRQPKSAAPSPTSGQPDTASTPSRRIARIR